MAGKNLLIAQSGGPSPVSTKKLIADFDQALP
jgi:hypothetical protein